MKMHNAHNKNWRIITSRKYIPGMRVTFQTHMRMYSGEILYRYATRNKCWENPATAILCKDGKVRTTQQVLYPRW